MQYYISSTNFSSERSPVEVNDDRTHDASRSSKTRLIWLRPDSQWPCGVIFARAERCSLSADSIGKALGVRHLIGKGGQFDPDGQYRIAMTALADAIRERSKAYHRSKSQRKLTHQMRIPPELLQ